MEQRQVRMATDELTLNRAQVLVLSAIVILLAAALTAGSVYYQRPNDPLCGRLGAGFPSAFICDVSGESPLSSVGRIDKADISGLNLIGSVIDLLFYALLLWGGLLLWKRFSERRAQASQEELAALAVQYRLLARRRLYAPEDNRRSSYFHADK
jgi:hypothetical protein